MAIERVFDATWQRCRVHWIRNALAHVSRGQHAVAAAAIRQAFDHPGRTQAGVVGIFPNEASITRLIGAVLFEQNDEWQTASRYMQVEAFAQIDNEQTGPILSIMIMTSGHSNYTTLTDVTLLSLRIIQNRMLPALQHLQTPLTV